MLDYLAKHYNTKMSVCHTNTLLEIESDWTRIQIIVINLLINALKSTQDGNIYVRVSYEDHSVGSSSSLSN